MYSFVKWRRCELLVAIQRNDTSESGANSFVVLYKHSYASMIHRQRHRPPYTYDSFKHQPAQRQLAKRAAALV